MPPQEHNEENVLPCGCVEKTTRDAGDKVIAQDVDNCIAHALQLAGSFLHHAGQRLLSDLEKGNAPSN